MIVAVKRNKKGYILKILSLIVVLSISAAYYVHLEKKHQEELKKELEVKQALKIQEEKKEKKDREKKELETVILSEIVLAYRKALKLDLFTLSIGTMTLCLYTA